MNSFIAIALGGAIGAVGRYGFVQSLTRYAGVGFPYGTMGVNIIGSICMGMIVGLSLHHVPMSENLKLFLVVGVLGGFTTFSAFSLDTINLIESGEVTTAIIYVSASVILSILGLWLGITLTRIGIPT